MARAKFTSLETAITGKQGGQSIAYGRNGFTLRNTTQPPITASTKQSYQRLITGSLWKLYSTLSPSQKTAWSTESINYPWVDSLGNARTRTGFETFSFCNQNLLILGLPFLTDPATFAGIVKPVVNVVSTSETTFVIQSDNTNANQKYAVFVQLFQSVGRSSIQPNKILIVNLTAAQLSAGYNLVPDYSAVIPTPQSIYSAIIKVVAINVNNGNRDLDGVIVRQLVDPTGLGLDILSYYPFNGNANDYFGVNNGVLVDSSTVSGGYVDKALRVVGSSDSHMMIPNSASIEFCTVAAMQPFSVYTWLKFVDANYMWFFSKRGTTLNPNANDYQFVTWNNTFYVNLNSDNNTKKLQISQASNFNSNQWYNFCMVFEPPFGLKFYLDGVEQSAAGIINGWTRFFPSGNNLYIGKASYNNNYFVNGYYSELTLFNQALSQAEINTIITANNTGQTIIDIN